MSGPHAALARELGCLTEEEMAALAQAEVSTLRNWRSRRVGPPYVALGNSVLYPIAAAREWIARSAEDTMPQHADPAATPRRRAGR